MYNTVADPEFARAGGDPGGGGRQPIILAIPRPPPKKTAYNLTVNAASMDRPIQLHPVTYKRLEGIVRE